MGWFSFLDPVLNTVLGPLLSLPPLWATLLIAFIMTLVLTLAYKYFTDQDLMKDLKDQIKAFQAQMKELKDKPEEMMKVQKKSMEINMKYMMHSMKPTLFTFIPIILIFGWLQSSMAFVPIMPGAEFTIDATFLENTKAILEVIPSQGIELLTDSEQPIVDNSAQWGLKGEKGNYQLKITHEESTQTHNLKIDDTFYNDPTSTFKDSSITQIKVNQEKLIVMNLFGWKLGWLGAYIIFSIVLSIFLRKVLKVY